MRPIAIEYDENRAEIIGSSVLLEIVGRRFVVTTGHVGDWSIQHALMIGGCNSFWALPPLRTNAISGHRADDPLDIAFTELDVVTADALGNVRFLQLHELDLTSHAVSAPFYTVIGYPVASQQLDAVAKNFKTVATVFSNTALPDSDYCRLSKGNFVPSTNLALRFNPSRVVSSDGVKALKDQKGLSGGGVWRFESLLDPSAPDRLVGITIYAQKAGTKALVATRIAVFVAAILQVYPEPATHFPGL